MLKRSVTPEHALGDWANLTTIPTTSTTKTTNMTTSPLNHQHPASTTMNIVSFFWCFLFSTTSNAYSPLDYVYGTNHNDYGWNGYHQEKDDEHRKFFWYVFPRILETESSEMLKGMLINANPAQKNQKKGKIECFWLWGSVLDRWGKGRKKAIGILPHPWNHGMEIQERIIAELIFKA